MLLCSCPCTILFLQTPRAVPVTSAGGEGPAGAHGDLCFAEVMIQTLNTSSPSVLYACPDMHNFEWFHFVYDVLILSYCWCLLDICSRFTPTVLISNMYKIVNNTVKYYNGICNHWFAISSSSQAKLMGCPSMPWVSPGVIPACTTAYTFPQAL